MTTSHEDVIKTITGARAKANARAMFEGADPTHGQADVIAALTENSGAIGGSNDGNLPSLTATAAELTEAAGAIGGSNDGDIPDLSTPTAALCAAGVRELAVMVNKLVADNIALRAAVREVADKVNDTLAELKEADLMAEA